VIVTGAVMIIARAAVTGRRTTKPRDGPMTLCERRHYRAGLEIVPETTAFVEAFCDARGIGHDDRLRIVLIVEELVTNTVLHGHASGAPISLTLALVARSVTLLYEDTAPAFDPTPWLSHSHDAVDEEVLARPVGNLGLRLIGQIAAGFRYAREGEHNRLWMTVTCGAVS